MINISEQESAIFGLRFARSGSHIASGMLGDVYRELYNQSIDVCRVKVEAADPGLTDMLNRHGIPWHIFSIIVRNEVEIKSEDIHFDSNGLDFEPFSSDAKAMAALTKEGMQLPTATNFSNSILNKLISKEKEFEAAENYFLGFKAENESRIAWLIKKQNENVGFLLVEIRGDMLEGIFYGITNKLRGSGIHGKTIMGFIKHECVKRGLRFFRNDVIVQNIPSLKSIIKSSIDPVNIYFNIHITPFFGMIETGENYPVKETKDLWKLAQVKWDKAIESGYHPLSTQYAHCSGRSRGYSLSYRDIVNDKDEMFYILRLNAGNENKEMLIYQHFIK